jgi:hypothetical protein
VGGDYSSSSLDDSLILDINTNEIDVSGGVIRVNSDQILQIRVPEKDIEVIPTTLNTIGI